MNLIRDTDTLLGKCWVPLPLRDHGEDFNSERYRAAEMPSFNGHGTTRSVARLFCALACGGTLDGVRLLSDHTTAYARREAWHQTDVFGIPSRMSYGGFMLCNDAFTAYNHNPHSFGHIGLGGAVAFDDPDTKLGFSFCGNRMAPIADMGPYAKRLLHATQRSL